MKYIVIVGDGMADLPVADLGGRTPLAYASTPNLDRLAQQGDIGSVRTVPPGFHPGSDVANLSILGYDPREYYSGRAPLEAASMGIELADGDIAFRCNLVTLRYDDQRTCAVLEDYSAGHITTEEATSLMKDISGNLGSDIIAFYPGISYRHLMVWRGGQASLECVPPHDITGREIADYLPAGEGEDVLRSLMRRSVDILENHPVNRQRVSAGKNPANSIWFWGQGRRPSMPTFSEKYGLRGALVSAVDLTRGLGVLAGFEILKVPGVTGYIDTNYEGKASYSLKALETVDFVYIHVEAPDEAGHSGKLQDKIKAIEDFDSRVVGPVVRGAQALGDHRILVMPDHPTPVALRTHTGDPVPFILYDSRTPGRREGVGYDESILGRPDIMVVEEGFRLMDSLIRGE